MVVCLINAGQYLAKFVGTSGELGEKRRKQVVEVLFIGVPEIEVEVGHGG
jgi:hypothetical protein